PSPPAACSTTRSTNVVTAGHLRSSAGPGHEAVHTTHCPLQTPLQHEGAHRAVRPSREDGQASTASPSTTLRPRRVPNLPSPSVRAKSVSSPPRPTLTPGWKCVPRWRTMISPALTTWPPERLTPRRCALESRPLRAELAPFLCAMG